MSSLDEISAKAEGDTKEVAKLKTRLVICFFYQMMLLVASTAFVFKFMIRYDLGLSVFLLSPIILGFQAVHLGDIGRCLNESGSLKLYLIWSYIAMFLLLAMKIHTLLVDFESGVVQYSLTDHLLIRRIIAMIQEIVAPIVATRITLPLIRSLSSSSSSRSM